MEFVPVVIRDQACTLLIGLWLKAEHGFGTIGMMFLPASNQRLFKPASEAFAPGQHQGPGFKPEQAIRLGRSQPLKLKRQTGVIKSGLRPRERGSVCCMRHLGARQKSTFSRYIPPSRHTTRLTPVSRPIGQARGSCKGRPIKNVWQPVPSGASTYCLWPLRCTG